jgi:hypothetical protein
LEGYPQADLSIAIVWISMMDSDVLAAAQEAVNSLDDPRVSHFFDPEQLSGKAVAGSLGNPGEVAWDMYLFYQPGASWKKEPPAPLAWMHQLSDSWADPERLHIDEDLAKELHNTMAELFRTGEI